MSPSLWPPICASPQVALSPQKSKTLQPLPQTCPQNSKTPASPPLPPPWTCTSRNPTPSLLPLSTSHFPSLQTLLLSPKSRIGLETTSGHFVLFRFFQTCPWCEVESSDSLSTGRPCNSCVYARIIVLVSTVPRGWPLPTKPTPTFAQTCVAANWRESQLLFPSVTRWSILNTTQALPFTQP